MSHNKHHPYAPGVIDGPARQPWRLAIVKTVAQLLAFCAVIGFGASYLIERLA